MSSSILITGAAGFIGSHLSAALHQRGHRVTACDRLPDDGAAPLRAARVRALLEPHGLRCFPVDISDARQLDSLWSDGPFDVVLHLAAQAGVRRSAEAPLDFVRDNLLAYTHILEACRRHPGTRLLYASSSSVYGEQPDGPVPEDRRTDQPLSFYAATKQADELMARCYASQFGVASLGLRFFTVYGPWGRPDMAALGFAHAIREGQPIRLYGGGLLERDFTYIGDVVHAVVALVEQAATLHGADAVNIGHSHPVPVTALVAGLERALGRTAQVEHAERPPGDVARTCADDTRLRARIGDWPHTPLETGLQALADWLNTWNPKT